MGAGLRGGCSGPDPGVVCEGVCLKITPAAVRLVCARLYPCLTLQ